MRTGWPSSSTWRGSYRQDEAHVRKNPCYGPCSKEISVRGGGQVFHMLWSNDSTLKHQTKWEESPNKEGAICASNGSYQNATHETIKRHGLLRDTCSLLHLSCLPAQPSLVQVANVGPPLQKDHQLTSSGFAFRNTETCSAQNLKTAVRTASAPANAFKAKDGG